jgi:glycosyltransferase involved in cell wall biosynthesis
VGARRFGIDGTGWLNRRGFGRFTRNAITRLVETDSAAEYVLFVDRATAVTDLPAAATVLVVETRRPSAEAAGEGSRRDVADVLRVARATRAEKFDAVLFPSLHTWFPFSGAPAVIGIHDTIADDLPELTIPGRRDRALWQLKQRLAVRGARSVFTVSEASRSRIADRLGVVPSSVRVVPEAADPTFSPRSAEDVAAARTAIGAPERYFLFAGGISPHKNVTGLVDAYADLALRGPDVPALVLAGALEGESFASAAGVLRDRIERHGLDGRVILPGFVPDETLARLYTGALAFVNPSLGEGFGLPAVEAAACGAPLVLSDLPAHRESMGDAALFVPPGDTAALAAALETILNDDVLRRSLALRAKEAVGGRTWDAAAAALADLLREASR